MSDSIRKTPGGNYVKLMSTTEMSKIGVMAMEGDVYTVILNKDMPRITMNNVKSGKKITVLKDSNLYKFLCTLLDSVSAHSVAIRVRA